MSFRGIAAALVLSTFTASAVSAQAISRRATGLAAPAFTIDFNSTISGSFPGVVNGVDFGTSWQSNSPGNCGGAFATQAVYNFGCIPPGFGPVNPASILFSAPVNGVAFNLITNDGATTTLTAFLGGNQVATFSQASNLTTPESFWYGFEGITFDRVDVREVGNNGSIGIDNVQVGVVPEPGSLALVAVGLTSLLVVARRRRA